MGRCTTSIRTGRMLFLLVGLLLLASQQAAAVVPMGSQGYVERPIGGGGFNQQPAYGAYGGGGFFEAHSGSDGQIWILDRQTGRVRSCLPPTGVDQRPRCSPWSE